MNRNYYCKVNSQEEADKLLQTLHNIEEPIKYYSYTSEWNYIVFTSEEYWALSDKSEYLEDFKNKQEVPANELIQYVKGELPKKEVEFEAGKWYELKYLFNKKPCNILAKSTSDSINNLEFNKYYDLNDKKWTIATSFSIDPAIKIIYIKELSLQEIQQYLPDGHPDKQPKTLTVNDLVEGEIYYGKIIGGSGACIFIPNNCELYSNEYSDINKFDSYQKENCASRTHFLRIATPQERKWLIVCIKQDKFIEQSELDKYDDEGNLIQNFEFGKWYKATDKIFGKYIYFIKSTQEFYGFNCNGWVNETSGNLNLEGWIPATDQEVSDRLLSWARDKYKVGTTVKCLESETYKIIKNKIIFSENKIKSGDIILFIL